ncbi:hypothetical protein HYALB_00009689 [Hymenoscyphus albidus]|uniref:Uncharacterized protein n=1 Tax=Hymenoscyphus albidus TaxID=595503 RepID=A0A9N9LC59_9HELO|nr:hypothetical protein HYALB_00009689 [Hymenoscyphus albidus]
MGSRAAWHGTRIILRQVSPESIYIFDFLLEIYSNCSGDWQSLASEFDISLGEVDAFLEYAASFLSNIGNYYGSGDQKFIPVVGPEFFNKLTAKSSKLKQLYEKVAQPILSLPPFSLGFPSKLTQSSYYPESLTITREEITAISKALEERSVFPENIRIQKVETTDRAIFKVLQASVDKEEHREEFLLPDGKGSVRIFRGDHSEELEKISSCLTEASKYSANEIQRREPGLETPSRVENIFGFVEPYRDPHGIRAEFEGLVAISDPNETKILIEIVESSAKFIKRLPWANSNSPENNGEGPFEKALFDPPDFSSIHALAYCSSIIFPGINLPNYNDIRQECGFKNVIIANRMSAWVVLHELLGYGTGKLMCQENDGRFNFDINNPPIDPITEKPISSWYKAEPVGAYLLDDKELLAFLGFADESEITAEDFTYNLYLQLGVHGLRGLQNLNIDDAAHFAMLKCLLLDGGGFMTIECDLATERLIVRVHRSKFVSHGKPALGQMLLRLHMYRSTADVVSCRSYYEELSRDGENVAIKDYEASAKGVVQSWAERNV